MVIREAEESDAAGIARVHVDVWRTTYRGVVPDDYLAAMSCEKKERRWRKLLASGDGDDFVFVAETEEKRIVGFASAGTNQNSDAGFAGELHTIYLLENYQRRGIGKLLMKAVAERFSQQGTASMLLWVLGKNPFRAFYESLGGELTSERKIVIGDTPLVEIAYGWKNLDGLLES